MQKSTWNRHDFESMQKSTEHMTAVHQCKNQIGNIGEMRSQSMSSWKDTPYRSIFQYQPVS